MASPIIVRMYQIVPVLFYMTVAPVEEGGVLRFLLALRGGFNTSLQTGNTGAVYTCCVSF